MTESAEKKKTLIKAKLGLAKLEKTGPDLDILTRPFLPSHSHNQASIVIDIPAARGFAFAQKAAQHTRGESERVRE